MEVIMALDKSTMSSPANSISEMMPWIGLNVDSKTLKSPKIPVQLSMNVLTASIQLVTSMPKTSPMNSMTHSMVCPTPSRKIFPMSSSPPVWRLV